MIAITRIVAFVKCCDILGGRVSQEVAQAEGVGGAGNAVPV